ncbi:MULTISPECIES: iron uptake system protein EfeO [Campylobacter]|uniref:Iron uptake system protein EfeO n=1 Tax=Campylobacter porcelli TaxID=1660073 RepID=A0ABU7M4X5_9BACT|nr:MULTISPECIES: iron uptake system protein EfeO [unclassified Campylobacter]MCR8679220.1 EfeM/EfeO family lipoprotein [Campylobacter sp. RM19072]MCR8696726.1 EfeM/EfeO family lipoprotein [Campylobacter sp. RM19073]MEE3705131.1 iron uptake system protein EfeO [Campylobacter sp. CX2-8023-23]MEE3744752.1 iron uptake system protein EfeO [Campylobacter sp. CX2-4855-23]MEE3777076.1 iron uptake system protein EfeO [Campylobacter sp. CX2-4080-23]
MQFKKITLGLSALMLGSSLYGAVDLSKEANEYRSYVIGQIDKLLEDTEKFVGYLKSGDTKNAKKLYPLARMYYERSEPIAESFGELDPSIDARLADLQEDGKGEDDWSGFHKIEKILWVDNTTKGSEAVADKLLADIKELRAKVPTVKVDAELMLTGAVDLLNEVSTSKITGEEDIYSKTDLYDFKANIQGAQKIYEILKSHLIKKDPKLAKDIEIQFANVNNLLEKHNKSKNGYEYIGYDKLSKSDIKELAEAVNKLGEPLSKMGVILD